MSDVRSQAAEGFAAIAQGRAKPEDTFSSLIATLHAAAPQPGAPVVTQAQVTPGLKGVEAKAAALVQKYLGVNYQWGGTTPAGFDCSGLIQYVYRALGVNIPRTTYDQWDAGQAVDPSQLQPGDAVFFTGSDPKDGKPGHEGMYLGNGLFIEAPHSGAQVRVSKLADRSDFVGARRF
jgi:cell wall-associated NlpC family hydrolase